MVRERGFVHPDPITGPPDGASLQPPPAHPQAPTLPCTPTTPFSIHRQLEPSLPATGACLGCTWLRVRVSRRSPPACRHFLCTLF